MSLLSKFVRGLIGGGGGNNNSNNNSNAAAIQQQQQQQQEAQQRRDDDARIRNEQRAEQERNDNRNRFTTALDNAQGQARTAAQQRITARGLNYDDYGDLVETALARARSNVPDLDTAPGRFFTDDLVDSALNNRQTGLRDQYTRQVNQMFAPNVENTLFADNADDAIINRILGTQRQEAVNALDTAKRRGNLDDRGYSAAMTRLGDMETAGRSTAQTLGGTVLQRYRTTARDIAEGARSAAGSFTLGSTFDPQSYRTTFDNTTNDLRGRLDGDITGSLAGQSFFDVGDILTRGGSAQGAINPTPNSLDDIAARTRARDSQRGVGNGGTF